MYFWIQLWNEGTKSFTDFKKNWFLDQLRKFACYWRGQLYLSAFVIFLWRRKKITNIAHWIFPCSLNFNENFAILTFIQSMNQIIFKEIQPFAVSTLLNELIKNFFSVEYVIWMWVSGSLKRINCTLVTKAISNIF